MFRSPFKGNNDCQKLKTRRMNLKVNISFHLERKKGDYNKSWCWTERERQGEEEVFMFFNWKILI